MAPNPERRRLAEQSLLAFMHAYFKHLMTHKSGDYHKRLCREIELALMPESFLVGAIPREHAKTTIGTTIGIIYAICTRKKWYCCLWGANEEEAKGKLRNITNELMTNKGLQDDYGAEIQPMPDARSGTPEQWNDLGIQLANGTKVEARPFLGKARGLAGFGQRRPDLHVLDDPEDDTNVESVAWRRRAMKWYNKALINCLDSKLGSIIHLGTILHRDSILWQLLHPKDKREKMDWARLELKAFNPDGTPLWPERYSVEDLERKKLRIGSLAFNQEYMNNPIDPEAQRYRAEDFRWYDQGRLEKIEGRWCLPDPTRGTGHMRPLHVVGGVDMALGTDSHHDHSVFFTIGAMWIEGMEMPMLYVLDIDRYQVGPMAQVDRITKNFLRWEPTQIGMEAHIFQAVFAHQAASRALPVVKMNSIDSKQRRIDTGSVAVEQGRVWLPNGHPVARLFVEEAESYPSGEHDDMLDAFVYAQELCSRTTAGRHRSAERRNNLRLQVVGMT